MNVKDLEEALSLAMGEKVYVETEYLGFNGYLYTCTTESGLKHHIQVGHEQPTGPAYR